jgi:hypothetical protein
VITKSTLHVSYRVVARAKLVQSTLVVISA